MSKQGDTFIKKLVEVAAKIDKAYAEVEKADEEWDKAAQKGCGFFKTVGGDVFECSNPKGDADNPFCYSDNCPILKHLKKTIKREKK